MYYKWKLQSINDNNLKITYFSICTYIETKENYDNDKWLFFKIPKIPYMKYMLILEKHKKNINE